MSVCGKLFAYLFVAILALLFLMLFRSEVYFPYPSDVEKCNETHTPIGGKPIIERFQQALRIKTITWSTKVYDVEPRIEFANFLRKNFPTIYSSPLVTFETVSNYSLLFTIKGSDPSLKPYLLCSHLDVVPVELDKWDVDPFGGIIKDGFIYGRGTIDVKNTLMAIMESLEYLLQTGFKPKRPFYIAFGHDEEGLGMEGAAGIAKVFAARGIKEFEYLLDEGMNMFKNAFPGINDMVAVIGVAEKGFLTVNVKAHGAVGHSSMAPVETAITTLAKAVSKLTGVAHRNLFGLGPEKDMFESFANYASYPYKLVYSNLWFFGPIISRMLSQQPATNGLVRTTSAVTIINGGFKENVLPSFAEATVNHRVHPMQTIEEVVEYDKQLIDDPRVEVTIKGDSVAPHPISPYTAETFGYETIKKSLNQVFADTIVIPGVMLATTDTRWYLPFTKSVYRFSPSIMMTTEDTTRFHGHNERISVDNYLKTVNFYHHLMLNSDKATLDRKMIKDEL